VFFLECISLLGNHEYFLGSFEESEACNVMAVEIFDKFGTQLSPSTIHSICIQLLLCTLTNKHRKMEPWVLRALQFPEESAANRIKICIAMGYCAVKPLLSTEKFWDVACITPETRIRLKMVIGLAEAVLEEPGPNESDVFKSFRAAVLSIKAIVLAAENFYLESLMFAEEAITIALSIREFKNPWLALGMMLIMQIFYHWRRKDLMLQTIDILEMTSQYCPKAEGIKSLMTKSKVFGPFLSEEEDELPLSVLEQVVSSLDYFHRDISY